MFMARSLGRVCIALFLALVVVGKAHRAEGQVLVFNPGTTTSVAGNGTTSYSSASYAGVATAAGLNFPRRIVIDASGNLYWIEKGGNVARVLASGNGKIPALPSVASPVAGWVYTVAGNGGTTSCSSATDSFGDGCPATQAPLNGPYGLAVDAQGNVYLDDSGNYLLRVVYAGGSIPGLPASPVVGNVYLLAGTGKTGSTGDGGSASKALIGTSHGLTVDAKGNVYFADSGNQSVRVVYVAGTIPGITSPVVGNVYALAGGTALGACASATSACGDGGPALAAKMNGPDSVGVDANGNIFFSDTSDFRLRAIYASGSLPGIATPVAGYIYTVAGNGVSGNGPDNVAATKSSVSSGMGQPFVDAVGNIYLPDATSNTVRKIDPTGLITTVAGGGSICAAHTNAAGDGCPANAIILNSPTGIVSDAAANLYIADYKNNFIRRIAPGASGLSFSGALGSAITAQTVVVSNAGTQALNLTSVAVTGPFALTSATNCTSSTTLAPGASCQVAVTPQATQAGTGSGSVSVASNATNAVSGVNTIALASMITVGPTKTSLSASPSLANVGQPVVLTATVSASTSGGISPGGAVTFLNGSTTLGSASLTGTQASFTVSSLPAGSYSLTASYGGDANYASSTSSAAALTVSATPVPVVTLSAPATPVVTGQAVSIPVTVAAYTGSSIPTGAVTLMEGSNALAQATLSAGKASFTVPSLPVGLNTLYATYGGDTTFTATASQSLTVAVSSAGQLTVFPGKLTTVAGSHALGSGFSGDNAVATAAQLKTPLGLALDAAGNLYVADSANNRIRRVDATTGNITTVAGTGTACATASLPCGDGGKAISALLNGPQAVRLDLSGNLYILDKGDHAVRKVSAVTGNITTVAGTLGTSGYTGDGSAATSAKLNGPRGLFVDNGGNLFIADSGNAVVREVSAMSGVITTFAGGGTSLGDGGPATSAQFSNPRGLAVDAAGSLYVADMGAYRIRRIDAATGTITTVAGTGTVCTAAPCGDGGMATSAQLAGPQDVVLTPAGDLLFTDPNLNVVRRVSPAGFVSTIAGQQSSTAGYEADGFAATGGLLNYPNSLALSTGGDLYVSEANGSLVRLIAASISGFGFGDVRLGSTADKTFTLASTGSRAATISALALTGGFLQQPSGVTDCVAALTLPSGTSCSLDLQFQPLVSGSASGAATVTSDAGNAPSAGTQIALTGNGQANSGTTPQTLSFTALANHTYGDGPVMLSATASSGLTATFASVTGPASLKGNVLTILGVGTVSVTAYQFGDSTYAAATPVTQSFSVAPATLTVTADDQTRAVGAANPSLTYSVMGFVAGDTAAVLSGAPALSTAATTASPAGSYPIAIAQNTLQAANYTFRLVPGTLKVSGLPQTITFGALAGATYGAAPIPLTATSSSGLPVTYTASGPGSISGSTLSIQGTGTITVTASQAGNSTYAAATPVSQKLSVSPATLTVTANSVSRVINQPNPTFTASITGLVNGDGSSVLSGTPALSTTATQQSPLGSYPIHVAQGTLAAANYLFAFADGVLTVVPPPPDFTLGTNLTSLTLNRGTTGIVTVTLTPISNYKGSVTLSCGSLPAGVSCNFSPATLTADGSGNAVTGTLSVVTTETAALESPFARRTPAALAGFGAAGLLLLFGWRRPRFRGLRLLVLLVCALSGTAGLTGCGSGQTHVAPVVTSITVTGSGTAGSGNAAHTLNLNLTII